MKRLFLGKFILVLGIITLAMGVSYITTYYMDDMYENINLKVTLEDTKEVSVSLEKLDREEVLNTYPYIFDVKNEGKREVSYQIKIKDIGLENINSDELSYILFKDLEEIKSGTLGSLTDGVIGEFKIPSKETSTYKLYVYLNQEKEKGSYKYSLEILAL